MTTPSTKNGFRRRHLLGLGAAGLAALATSRTALAAEAPLRAEVVLKGKRFLFRQESGQSLGDFVSPIGGFTQECTVTRVAGCPLTVFFRPDRNSSRVEVVFELGGVFNSVPLNLGAYTVIISRGSQVLTTVDVPSHHWFSRWRWQSAARPIRGDIDALIAQNLLPPLERGVSAGSVAENTINSVEPDLESDVCLPTIPLPTTPRTTPVLSGKYAPYSVMGLAGLVAYMPQTGERGDIGIVTEAQAEYIVTVRQGAHDVMRAQAEAGGTFPWHIRDENTNGPLSLKTYPGATWYSSTAQGDPYVRSIKTPVTIDSAHQPALAYVPYLLTGDPYHLENLQFQANWNLGTLVPQYRMTIPQSRTFAWNLRSLAQCARITPSQVPSWLLPKTYWTEFLSDYRTFFETEFVNSPEPERRLFRVTTNIDNSRDEGPTAPKGTWTGVWEEDFIATILGWVVAMGFTEWRPAFQWKIASTIARTSATSGWKRAFATPYRMILRPSADAPIVNSWPEAWNLTQRVAKLNYANPNTWAEDDMAYLAYTRGALVYADRLKVWDVSENLAWATAQLRARNWNTAYKWRLGKGLL